jgi:hypothetical protein
MGGKPGLEENWRQQAEALKREVQNLPKGREREEVLLRSDLMLLPFSGNGLRPMGNISPAKFPTWLLKAVSANA